MNTEMIALLQSDAPQFLPPTAKSGNPVTGAAKGWPVGTFANSFLPPGPGLSVAANAEAVLTPDGLIDYVASPNFDSALCQLGWVATRL